MSRELPLIQAMQLYLERCLLDEQSSRTIEGKQSTLRLFVRWYIVYKGFYVSSLTLDGLLEFIKYLHSYRDPQNNQLISKATRRNKITAVKMFCLYLFQHNYTHFNFADKIKIPKPDKAITQEILQPDEVQAIANQTFYGGDKGIRDSAILAVLFTCGARRGDITKLKLRGINEQAKLLFIPDGKGGKDRIVPITQEALALVVYYRDNVRSKHVSYFSEDCLFLDNKGLPFRGGQITELVSRYKRRAGVSKRGASMLYRHTSATMLINNGANLLTTQKLLGHASVATTQGYVHLAVKKMSEDYQKYHPAVQNPNLYIPRNHPVYLNLKEN